MKTPRQLVFGAEETPTAFRGMLLSLFLAFGILFGGMFWTYHVGLQANQLDHQVSHAQEALEDLQRPMPPQKAGTS